METASPAMLKGRLSHLLEGQAGGRGFKCLLESFNLPNVTHKEGKKGSMMWTQTPVCCCSCWTFVGVVRSASSQRSGFR